MRKLNSLFQQLAKKLNPISFFPFHFACFCRVGQFLTLAVIVCVTTIMVVIFYLLKPEYICWWTHIQCSKIKWLIKNILACFHPQKFTQILKHNCKSKLIFKYPIYGPKSFSNSSIWSSTSPALINSKAAPEVWKPDYFETFTSNISSECGIGSKIQPLVLRNSSFRR